MLYILFNLMFQFFLGTFTIYYLTQVLLLGGNGGPFASKTVTVVWNRGTNEDEVEADMWPAGLSDRVRGVFGLYDTDSNLWVVRPERDTLWSCTKCLSFYVSILIWATITVANQDLNFMIFIPASAGIVTWLDNFSVHMV